MTSSCRLEPEVARAEVYLADALPNAQMPDT